MTTALEIRDLCEETVKGMWLSVIGAQKIEEEVIPNDYPVLTSFGVDLSTDYQVEAILRDFPKLSKKGDSNQILCFEQANNKLTTMVQIPMSVRLDRFLVNLRTTGWF
jgi:hypothetical protein